MKCLITLGARPSILTVTPPSSLLGTLPAFQHGESIVGEYSMSWSDAARVEAAFGDRQAAPDPSGEPHRFGTLGRALWRDRSLAWILRLHPDVRPEDAEKIVTSLSARVDG